MPSVYPKIPPCMQNYKRCTTIIKKNRYEKSFMNSINQLRVSYHNWVFLVHLLYTFWYLWTRLKWISKFIHIFQQYFTQQQNPAKNPKACLISSWTLTDPTARHHSAKYQMLLFLPHFDVQLGEPLSVGWEASTGFILKRKKTITSRSIRIKTWVSFINCWWNRIPFLSLLNPSTGFIC